MQYNSYTKLLDYELTLDTHPSLIHSSRYDPPQIDVFFYPHTLALFAYHQQDH